MLVNARFSVERRIPRSAVLKSPHVYPYQSVVIVCIHMTWPCAVKSLFHCLGGIVVIFRPHGSGPISHALHRVPRRYSELQKRTDENMRWRLDE